MKTYTQWLKGVPLDIQNDSLWKIEIYRKALFLSDIAWHDCEKLIQHPLGKPIAWQLIRSSGSISANIEEGYGRGFGKDYARFLRIALGSARETRGWYFRGNHLLDPVVVNHRYNLLKPIFGGLITMVNQQKEWK